ncbi:MAG: GtrA family protein [Georgfuchsia sp.]
MNSSIANIAVRLRLVFSREFVGYFAASVVALAVDMFLLLQLAKVMHPLAAATIAFLTGLLVCYALTVRYVFSARRFKSQRAKEATVFFLVGLVGLGINDAVIYLGHMIFMLPLAISKLTAASMSFLFNFGGRKYLLFRAAQR